MTAGTGSNRDLAAAARMGGSGPRAAGGGRRLAGAGAMEVRRVPAPGRCARAARALARRVVAGARGAASLLSRDVVCVREGNRKRSGRRRCDSGAGPGGGPREGVRRLARQSVPAGSGRAIRSLSRPDPRYGRSVGGRLRGPRGEAPRRAREDPGVNAAEARAAARSRDSAVRRAYWPRSTPSMPSGPRPRPEGAGSSAPATPRLEPTNHARSPWERGRPARMADGGPAAGCQLRASGPGGRDARVPRGAARVAAGAGR